MFEGYDPEKTRKTIERIMNRKPYEWFEITKPIDWTKNVAEEVFNKIFSVEDFGDYKTITYNIAGTKKEDIKIEVVNNEIITSIKGEEYNRYELFFNYDEVTSKYEEGLLVITITKPKSRTVEVL